MIEDLEVRNMLRKEEDQLGAILKINSGAGGTESNDWASMLMRMYLRWAERNNYKVKELDFQAGDEVGVKSVIIEIDGEWWHPPTRTVYDHERDRLFKKHGITHITAIHKAFQHVQATQCVSCLLGIVTKLLD